MTSYASVLKDGEEKNFLNTSLLITKIIQGLLSTINQFSTGHQLGVLCFSSIMTLSTWI